MTKYELSISADYVPTWGVVEAVREFFQNALDEETRDRDNKMFVEYDENSEVLRIGNKHGKLDPQTLLFGYTDKDEQTEMIGNHGEGYKIATVVLLRMNKQIVFYNYGHRQVWTPKFVNSRKYGVKVPTFFVDTKHVWQSVPDNDLVIEITGITRDEYKEIVASNLHLREENGEVFRWKETSYGRILTDENFKGQIYVGGLFICSDPRLDIGVDFHPNVVKLERDRSMVNSFDVQWYVSRMIAETEDVDLIEKHLPMYSGAYISSAAVTYSIKDELAKRFLDEYGLDAVPVVDQRDCILAGSKNTVIVSKSHRELILTSNYYQQNSTSVIKETESLYSRFMSFANDIREDITDYRMRQLVELITEVKELEAKVSTESEEEDTEE